MEIQQHGNGMKQIHHKVIFWDFNPLQESLQPAFSSSSSSSPSNSDFRPHLMPCSLSYYFSCILQACENVILANKFAQ